MAAALVIALTLPAAAIDHEFGGYWRVRAFTQQKFSGEDTTEAQDLTRTDSRTRLYYTAKFSDTFKFVNKFEFDWVYGDSSLGDIGADGKEFEIKNSYVDFYTWNKKLNWKIGIQGYEIARGFVFSDDFSGMNVAYEGDGWKVPFVWVKAYEGGEGQNKNDEDVDYYAITPYFKWKNLGVNPYFMYIFSDDGASWGPTSDYNEVNIFYVGVDLNYTLQGWNFWATTIYNGGDAEQISSNQDQDFNGYLFGLGAKGAMGPVGLHGQFVYASGDDNPDDNDMDAFVNPEGASYYWSEIMGYGIFDNQASANSPEDQISNVWFIGGGVDYNVIESLKLNLDLWYASLNEKTTTAMDEYLGTEIDFKATWKIMPNLNLDFVAAYLFAGDGTYDGDNQSDPYEIGTRLALTF